MRKLIFSVLLAITLCGVTTAQQKLVDEVKISSGVLSPTIDTYKKALASLQPAFSHPETKDKVDAWALAGNIAYALYDKYNDNIAIGKNVNDQDRADALIKAYDFYLKALPLDTMYLLDKKGNIRIDKKTGAPRYRVKNSKDIMKRIYAHASDYLYLGYSQLENQRYESSHKLLTVYTNLAESPQAIVHNFSVPDSVMGLVNYYKGIDLYYLDRYAETVKALEDAMRYGYRSKGVMDLAIDCYKRTKQDTKYISMVSQAYDTYGTSDDAYSRILINHYISKKNYEAAHAYINNSLTVTPNDDKLLNLKGLVVENAQGLDSAFVYYNKAITANPENAEAQFNVGRYYYNKAIQFREENPSISRKKLKSNLSALYKQALPHFEIAYKQNPYDTALRDALMNIYYQLGDGKKLKEIEASK